ncbi:hypothetical protein Btru_006853 [Bulinus truncatus]|nr:hypothetical protein Btru_006853 [Bulinus truncatus]
MWAVALTLLSVAAPPAQPYTCWASWTRSRCRVGAFILFLKSRFPTGAFGLNNEFRQHSLLPLLAETLLPTSSSVTITYSQGDADVCSTGGRRRSDIPPKVLITLTCGNTIGRPVFESFNSSECVFQIWMEDETRLCAS